MKYALIDGNKVEASKGAKGKCPYCESELTSKCGNSKAKHWAHKAIRNCDPWWENETDWHRAWKNNYLKGWQEKILFDENTHEKHIADIRTADGLVIEFQHSHLNPDERIAREKFYKNIVWVVDSTRLKKDYSRFDKGRMKLHRTNNPNCFIVDLLDECFPTAWTGSSGPVIFDFRGNEPLDGPRDLRNYLFCLLPKKNDRYTTLLVLSRQYFIDSTINGKWSQMITSFSQRPNQKQQLHQGQAVRHVVVKRESPYVFYKGRYVKRRRL